MTADDDRTAYLSGEDAGPRLDDADRAELDAVRALLADPSVWAEPPADLEAAVVAAVAADAGRAQPATVPAARRTAPRRALLLVGAAAAAVAAVVAVTVAAQDGSSTPSLEASLAGTPLAASAEGHATLTKTDAGWRIELDATGLPRRDEGDFYQAWLRAEEGDPVPIGTFNEADDVVLWAGVSPRDFSTITVTEEAADDGTDASGRKVLVGTVVDP